MCNIIYCLFHCNIKEVSYNPVVHYFIVDQTNCLGVRRPVRQKQMTVELGEPFVLIQPKLAKRVHDFSKTPEGYS